LLTTRLGSIRPLASWSATSVVAIPVPSFDKGGDQTAREDESSV
jgi:hypothetical protein